MAVPPVPSRTVSPAPTAKFLAWLRNIGSSLARPLFAVILAMIAGSIVIFITTPGDRFATVINAYQALFTGSFGDPYSLSYTLVKVGPLIFTGISVAIANRAGLFNIGAEGQLAVGAMTAGIIAFKLPTLPGLILVPLMIIGSMLAGAVWGGIVGILKAWRGAHEVVTTIMLNWIAFYVTDYLIDVPFKAPNEATQTPSLPPQAQLPTLTVFYNQTLGTFLPKIANPQSYLTDVSFLIALLALVVYWFITSRTTFGYELRVIGQNPKAARYAGIPIKRNLFFAMAIAGASSGLAGALHLMGQSPYQLIGSTFSLDPTGFDAVGVALLGRTTAIGVLLASLLFGGLREGGNNMQLSANIPGDLVYILQALVLFSIAAEFLPAIQRSFGRWIDSSRRPALVPNITGSTVVPLSETEVNGTEPGNDENGSVGAIEDGTLVSERRSDRIEEG
jgi:general nucleoside transport system permease protein